MNVVQLHERVLFWLDTVGSSRFESSDIDNAVNIAMNDIIRDKYDSTKRRSPREFFQMSQKLRDELSNIVKGENTGSNLTLTHVGEFSIIEKNSIPSDYMYLLAIGIIDSSNTRHNCWPITYDRINTIHENPFRRVRITPSVKVYYFEAVDGIKLLRHNSLNFSFAEIHYLAKPMQWSYGVEYDNTHTFSNGNIVIVSSATAVYNGATYLRGQEITIGAIVNISSGNVIFGYTNSDINETLHEDIARKGAEIALLSIKEFDKVKALIEYFS